jgi:hypothetical protein
MARATNQDPEAQVTIQIPNDIRGLVYEPYHDNISRFTNQFVNALIDHFEEVDPTITIEYGDQVILMWTENGRVGSLVILIRGDNLPNIELHHYRAMDENVIDTVRRVVDMAFDDLRSSQTGGKRKSKKSRKSRKSRARKNRKTRGRK